MYTYTGVSVLSLHLYMVMRHNLGPTYCVVLFLQFCYWICLYVPLCVYIHIVCTHSSTVIEFVCLLYCLFRIYILFVLTFCCCSCIPSKIDHFTLLRHAFVAVVLWILVDFGASNSSFCYSTPLWG